MIKNCRLLKTLSLIASLFSLQACLSTSGREITPNSGLSEEKSYMVIKVSKKQVDTFDNKFTRVMGSFKSTHASIQIASSDKKKRGISILPRDNNYQLFELDPAFYSLNKVTITRSGFEPCPFILKKTFNFNAQKGSIHYLGDYVIEHNHDGSNQIRMKFMRTQYDLNAAKEFIQTFPRVRHLPLEGYSTKA